MSYFTTRKHASRSMISSAPTRWVRRAIGRVTMKTQHTVFMIAGVALTTTLIAIGFGVSADAPTKARVPLDRSGDRAFSTHDERKGPP